MLNTYTKKGLPGISLLVRDKDGLWYGASGKADMEHNIAMQPCQVSKIASVTKIFIGTLTMKLVEDGVLNLDDPLSKWLPAETISKIKNADQCTIRNLLNHSSGIADVISDNAFYLQVLNNPTRHWEPEELLEFVYGDEPLFTNPGDSVDYSNTNLLLDIMIIEKATGRPHEQLLHERILQPLGLSDTYYQPHDPLPAITAQGYYDLYNNGTLVNMSNFNTGSGNGYGGMFSNVFDMQRFIEALLRDKTLLTPAGLAEMTRITGDDWGEGEHYGVTIRKEYISDDNAIYCYGHRGRDLAYSADLFYYPVQDVTVALIVNYGTDADSGLRQTFRDFRDELMKTVAK